MQESDCLKSLLSIACNVFEAHSTVLFLPCRGGPGGLDHSRFRVAEYFSLGEQVLHSADILPGKGLAGWIIKNREPLLINNFDKKRSVLGYYEKGVESKIRAFMGCPLDNGQGALCVDSKRTYSFSTKDQKILSQFARLVSGLQGHVSRLENDIRQFTYYQSLQVIKGLRDKRMPWEQFFDESLDVLSAASNFSHVMLAVRDEVGSHYQIEAANRPVLQGSSQQMRFPIGSGLVGYVFKNHTQLVKADDSPVANLFGRDVDTGHFATVICMPLVFGRITRGVLVLASPTPQSVDSGLVSFVSLVADMLTQLFENLYLKNRIARMASRSVAPSCEHAKHSASEPNADVQEADGAVKDSEEQQLPPILRSASQG